MHQSFIDFVQVTPSEYIYVNPLPGQHSYLSHPPPPQPASHTHPAVEVILGDDALDPSGGRPHQRGGVQVVEFVEVQQARQVREHLVTDPEPHLRGGGQRGHGRVTVRSVQGGVVHILEKSFSVKLQTCCN